MGTNKKILRAFALVLCLCMILSSFCACHKSTSKTIRVPLSTLPNCFDPQIANGIDIESIVNNCYEGLVRIDADGNIQKGVAQSWNISNDGCTYTFKLRSNAMWHLPKKAEDVLGEDYESTFDTHVKASDFVFAINRAISPETNAPLANALVAISNVYADDDTTLIIKLSRPSVGFLSVLASPICMPCNEEFFEATSGRYGLNTDLILSNGPYYIGNIDEATGVSLYSSDNYNGEYKAVANTIKFLFPSSMVKSSGNSNSDSNTDDEPALPNLVSLLSVEEGGFDAATVTHAESLKLEESFTIRKYKNSIKAICFNANRPHTSDENLRLALAHATDIKGLRGVNEEAEGIVPSCCELVAGTSYRAGSDIISSPEYNLEVASKYIESNVPVDTITLDFICLKDDETSVKEMLQQWQKLFGVSLSIKLQSFDTQSELDKAVSSGKYDIAYTTLTASEFLSSDFLNRFKAGSGTNIICLSSGEYDNLLNNIYNSSSEQSLINANKAAETFLVSHAYILPVYVSNGYLAVKDTAKQISVRPSGTVYAFYTSK